MALGGVCSAWADDAYTVSFSVGEGASVDLYYTQAYEDDVSVAADETNVTSAVARASDSGEVDTSGDGQVNFSVSVDGCHALESVSASGSYKNLKDSSDAGITNMYRLAKITGSATVTITSSLTGRSYGAVFTRTEGEDGTYSAAASLVCSECGDVVAIDAGDIAVTSEAVIEGTCTKAGVITCTATFTSGGVEHIGTYESEVAAIAHVNATYVLDNEASTYASGWEQTVKTKGTYVPAGRESVLGPLALCGLLIGDRHR